MVHSMMEGGSPALLGLGAREMGSTWMGPMWARPQRGPAVPSSQVGRGSSVVQVTLQTPSVQLPPLTDTDVVSSEQ